MHRVLGIVGALSLLLAGPVARTQAGEPGPKAKGEGCTAGKPMKAFAALDLTADHQQKLEKLHEAAAKQAEPLYKDLSAKMKEMRALWAVAKPDRAALERKHAEMSGLHAKLWGIHLDTKLQIHALLTPEQRARWTAEHAGPGMPGPLGACPHMQAGCPHAQTGDCPCMQAGACPHLQGGGGPCPHGGPGICPGCPHAGDPGAKPQKK